MSSETDGQDGYQYQDREDILENMEPDSPLGDLYLRRVKNNQDLVIVVSDYHNRRGTGKTILSLKLAEEFDRTAEGVTYDKCTISPEEMTDAYVEEEKGSAILLDEAEAGIGNREAMTNVNRAVRRILSMGRIEEKYLIINAPSSGHIDKFVEELADVWILVQRKGMALVHFLPYEPYNKTALTPKKQQIEWSDVEKRTDLRKVYNKLTREKRDRLRGEDTGEFIEAKEHKEKLEKAEKKANKRGRNEVLQAIWESELRQDIDQGKLAEAIGLDRSTVSKIANGKLGVSD